MQGRDQTAKNIISSLNHYNGGAKKNEKMKQRIAAQHQSGISAIQVTQEDSAPDLLRSDSHQRKTPEQIQQMLMRMQPKLVNVANGSQNAVGNKSRGRKPAMMNGLVIPANQGASMDGNFSGIY